MVHSIARLPAHLLHLHFITTTIERLLLDLDLRLISPSHSFFLLCDLVAAVNVEMDDGFLMNVCVVGGNAVSAFLSWRLQATNACDVTLVWKSGFDAVYQYGISFK